MVTTAIARYISALAEIGMGVEAPSEPPSPAILAELGRYHDASLPDAIAEVHRAFPIHQHLFAYYGSLMPLASTAAQALEVAGWMAGSPIPPRQHIPTFFSDAYYYTVALDPAHYGEVWRFAVEADAPETVRVCGSLEELFNQWAMLIEEGELVFDPDSNTIVAANDEDDDLLALWPRFNILAIPLGYPSPFRAEQQTRSGMDPAAFGNSLLDVQTDAFDEIDRLISELS